MKEIILKVITRESASLPLSIEDMRKFPTHHCEQVMFEEKLITIKYKPVNDFDEEGFKQILIAKFKQSMNAHYIEIVEMKDKALS